MTRRARSAGEIESCIRMAHCSPSVAASWLCGRPITFSPIYGVPETPTDSHLPEYILYRRRDPAIDVELAADARSRTVLGKLYDRGSGSLKAVLAANASLFVGDHHRTDDEPLRERDEHRHLLWSIVENGTCSELRAVCENSNIYQGFFGDLVTAWKPDDPTKLDETRFQTIIRFLGGNPLVAQSYRESRFRHDLDAFAEYGYNRFYVEAWKLAGKVPVTQSWAETLVGLYQRLHHPFSCLEDVNNVVARWVGEVGQYEAEPYRALRARICVAFVKPTVAELRSDDPARRDAFLMTFDPEAPEFQNLDWNEFLSLDRYWHLNVRLNMKVWASPTGRDTFRQMLWKDSSKDNNLTAIGFFDEQREQMKMLHPEWFVKPTQYAEPIDEESRGIDHLRGKISQLIEVTNASRNAWLVAAGLFAIGLLIGHWL